MTPKSEQEQMLAQRREKTRRVNTYPTITISVATQIVCNTKILTFSLQESKESIEETQIYQLSEASGKFDSENIRPVSGSIPNLSLRINNDKVTLEWRNPNSSQCKLLQLHVSPQGDLVVKHIGKDKTVNLTTTEIIIIQDPIEAKNLSLNARQVFVKSSINCSVLQVTGVRKNEKVEFRNSGKIVTKALKLSRITEATNTGIILVQETLKCAAQYFENLGHITAKEASFTLKYRFVNTKSGVFQFDKLLRLDCEEGLCKNAGWLFVKAGGATQFVKDFRNSGHYISEGPIIIFADGRVRNKGPLVSKNSIRIFSEKSLVNADKATIYSEGPAELFSKSRIKNYNKIKSGAVSINTLDFENLEKASIIADWTLSVSSLNIIRNAGLFKAPTISVRSDCILDNLMQGIILAGEKLNLFSREILENNGIILSNGPLKVDAGKILKNLKDGKMAAYGDMLLLAGHILSNAGKVLGDNKVTLQAAHWFENALGSEVASGRTLTVKSGYRLDNFGKLEGKNKIYAEALEILHNHQTGVISTQESLKAVSKWVLQNDGILHSEGTLKLEVDLILENCRSGRITALESLQLLNASLIKNSGEAYSQDSLMVKADIIKNFAGGDLTAENAITLISQHHVEQAGKTTAKKIDVSALTFSQQGSMNVETLTLNIQEIFKLHKEGHISASNAVTVLTKNLILLGQLRGKGEFRLEASENFEYSPDTLWACGLLRLILHKGYSFEIPMNILGALNLESAGAINVLAAIHVAQNSDIIANVLMIEKEGGIFSANDLTLHVKEFIHCTRKIEIRGRGYFTALKITFQGENASLTVGKDCIVQGDFTSHYANIQIGGQFHHRGALVVRSHEADRRAREMERARRRAERRRDEGFFRGILGSIVSIAASCFLGPLGPVALSFGKFGFLAQGAISGGLGAAVAGKDLIEGAVSSAGFGLFGNVARNALVTMRCRPEFCTKLY